MDAEHKLFQPKSITIARSCMIISACLGAAILVSGCRGDAVESLSLDAGNAIAANKAIQAIDPWPDAAFRRHQSTNGKRIADAYTRYEAGPAPAGGTAAPSNGASASKDLAN